ncbi:MAG: prepilin peptidase [Jiangellaceae bacterium]|nr:prepilin peptidase [Jiangellaceae bacterium]
MRVLLGAGLGVLAGAFLPALLGRLPDRRPSAEEPVHTPYRELADGRRVRLLLATTSAAVCSLLALARGLSPDLPAYLAVGVLGVLMAYVDVREHRLPDLLTGPALLAGGVLLGVAALATGSWSAYARGWLAAAALFAGFLGLATLRPADLGLGDVKLAGVLGLMLGWLGWSTVVVGAFLGFVFGGLTGLVLVAVRRAGRRTAIPFGPFLLLGALAAVAWGDLIVAAYLGRG